MVRMHCVACCEPAFWAGYDRTSPQAFHDYFTHISVFEPTRAAQYCIQHYCWVGMNPKEADDVEFSKEVIAFLPEFLQGSACLGIGEIGLNKNTRAELTTFELQVDLAVKRGELVWIHTPHLADKKKGVTMLLDSLKSRGDVDPERVLFDHMEEHTIRPVLDAGYWAAMTIYPTTKNSPPRVVDTLERFGLARILVDASGDWGPSDPGTLHDAIFEMRKRGHREEDIETVFYNNPCYFLGQSPKFKPKPTRSQKEAWAAPKRGKR
jgi:predicted metal-dependent TIM-barrel fold hydrolase